MESIFSQYTSHRYIYPPRAEVKIIPQSLPAYDNGEFYGQPKYDGSCSVAIIAPGGTTRLYNRHNETLTLQQPLDWAALNPYPDRFMVLAGEYLNKAKKGEGGRPLNHCFVIWDLLVFNNSYLVGSSLEARQEILETLYGSNRTRVGAAFTMFDHLLFTPVEGIYRAPNYTTGFDALFADIQKTQLYEGLVLKRRSAKLELGNREGNNANWQVKVRKPHTGGLYGSTGF